MWTDRWPNHPQTAGPQHPNLSPQLLHNPSKKQGHGFSTWFWRMTLIYVGAATIFQANLAVSAWTIFLNTGHQIKVHTRCIQRCMCMMYVYVYICVCVCVCKGGNVGRAGDVFLNTGHQIRVHCGGCCVYISIHTTMRQATHPPTLITTPTHPPPPTN